jgi:hypothetical protein
VDWQAQALRIDKIVDDTFGIVINLVPWVEAQTSGQRDPFKEAAADSGRPRKDGLKGVYVSPSAAIEGFKGLNGTTLVEADLLISIRTDLLDGIQEKDHCEVPSRSFVGEINFITPGDTGRSLLHLIRVKQP